MAMAVFVIMMAVFGVAVLGNGTVRMLHPAIGQMGMIVMVLVDGQRRSSPPTEQRLVLGA